jgi:hypothetical protein
MDNSFLHMLVMIKISDPWELGESRKWQPFEGKILDTKVDGFCKALLIKLLEPFEYKKVNCEYFVANPRHEGSSYDELLQGKSVFSGLTCISPENAYSENPFDLSWWRGGVALIGEIEAHRNNK